MQLAKQLAEEAMTFAYQICNEEGRQGGPSDHIWFALCMGKYTELVVKECARTVEHINTGDNDNLGNFILRKFEVKS